MDTEFVYFPVLNAQGYIIVAKKEENENGDMEIVDIILSKGDKCDVNLLKFSNGDICKIGSFINDNMKYYFDNIDDAMNCELNNVSYHKFTGRVYAYDKENNLITKNQYRRGKLHGLYIFYHKNGNIKKIGRYCNSIKVGKWKLYDENGILEATASFKKNNIIFVNTYNDGVVDHIRKYKNGKIEYINEDKCDMIGKILFFTTVVLCFCRPLLLF